MNSIATVTTDLFIIIQYSVKNKIFGKMGDFMGGLENLMSQSIDH